MERYNLATITKRIYNSGFLLFNIKTLKNILFIKKESTLFSVVKKLINAGIITKIERDKYLLKEKNVKDFTIANFLYKPSYVSFESALNFYGVLSQFPYQVSSATVKKSFKKIFQSKLFVYNHLKKDLFWGYKKMDDFLIASPEKALLDQLYLSSNGHKKIDLDEYNYDKINISNFKKYLVKYPKTRQFKKTIKLLKVYLNV